MIAFRPNNGVQLRYHLQIVTRAYVLTHVQYEAKVLLDFPIKMAVLSAYKRNFTPLLMLGKLFA